jgi:hypothetical protein
VSQNKSGNFFIEIASAAVQIARRRQNLENAIVDAERCPPPAIVAASIIALRHVVPNGNGAL